MAVQPKYGPDEPPALQPGEPFFYLRAQDALAPFAVLTYAQLLRAAAAGLSHVTAGPASNNADASELRENAAEVEAIAARMLAWQASNGVKLPD